MSTTTRPLKHRLELAVMAWLDAGKSGTAFAAVPIVSSLGANLTTAAASNSPPLTEPTLPFIAVAAALTGSDEMPGVYQYEIAVHLKSDATRETSSRQTPDLILADLHYRLMQAPAPASAWSDSNPAGGAFLAFANKPQGTDNRQAFRRPLHVYDVWIQAQPTEFDGIAQHDQLVLTGHCQEMDSHEDPPADP